MLCTNPKNVSQILQAVTHEVQPAKPAMSEKPKRRWFQFSLKAMLVVLTLVAVATSALVGWVDRQRRAVERVQQLGGRVDYANSEKPWREGDTLRNDSWLVHQLRKWLPRDYFDSVLRVELQQTDVSDADIRYLKGLTRLEILDLSYTEITDAGLGHVMGFSRLKDLYLDHTQVTDDGIAQLKGLGKLEIVFVACPNVSLEGAAKLQRELPNCDVVK
jgi:hypothetical protein